MPSVVLTREREDNAALARALSERGVRVVEYPCIETHILPYDGSSLLCGLRVEEFAAVVFSSRRGVTGMQTAALSLRGPRPLIAAVGAATAAAAAVLAGRAADLVSSDGTGEGLAAELVRVLPAASAVLHVRGSKSTGDVKRVFEASGMQVCEVIVYENTNPRLTALDLDGVAAAVFASPSAARRFFEVNPSARERLVAVAIGPTTEKALRSVGVARIEVAASPDTAELAKCVLSVLESPEEVEYEA